MLFFSTPCKSLLPLLFLLYFGTHQLVTAQNATERRRFRPYNYDNNNINYPLYLGLALAISIIFIVVTYLIIKFYCKPQETPRHLLLVLPNNQTSSGLDPTILETFPIFKYSNVPGHSNGTGHIECSVCLSPFEVDEMLRSLPKCNHVFHVSCLDPWLKDHNTCPLCRMNLVLEPSELAKAKMVRVDHESGGSEREGLGNHRVLEVRVEGDIEEGQYAIAKYKRWNSMGPAVEANWDKGDGEIIGKFKRSSSTL